MTDADPINPEGSGMVAAEYVLGVLGAAERQEAERRIAAEPAFAEAVAFWEARLGHLTDGVAPVTPPASAWPRIAQAIRRPASQAPASRESAPALWDSLAFWRGFGITSAGVALASILGLAYLATVPPPDTSLVASLNAGTGQTGFLASVNPNGTSLTIMPASLSGVDQRALELWLIPPGQQPRSLGLIQPGRPVRVNVPPDLLPQLRSNAVLAVSLEPPGGSPTGLPTGPIIANGPLTRL